jgi:hypothetical protein
LSRLLEISNPLLSYEKIDPFDGATSVAKGGAGGSGSTPRKPYVWGRKVEGLTKMTHFHRVINRNGFNKNRDGRGRFLWILRNFWNLPIV